MTSCEKMRDEGVCYPGIDKFDPVEFMEKDDLTNKPDTKVFYADRGKVDDIPYSWRLRAKEDIQYGVAAGVMTEYWICEDCHVLCEMNLAANKINQE